MEAHKIIQHGTMPHGTRYSYIKTGCRCVDCVAANFAYHHRYNMSRKGTAAAELRRKFRKSKIFKNNP